MASDSMEMERWGWEGARVNTTQTYMTTVGGDAPADGGETGAGFMSVEFEGDAAVDAG